MRIIVFGANGQLGQELQRTALPPELSVTAFTRDQVDIVDLAAVERAIADDDVGVVINAAAYTAVDRAESEAAAAWSINRDGPANLAAASAIRKVPLIHVSTDYVFDGSKPTAYVPDDALSPLGVYGASKAAGEDAVRNALHEHVIVRTSWVFSAFGNNFVKTMLRLAAERDELRVVADQFGRPTPAAHLAAALMTIVARQRGAKSNWGTYHYAGAGRASWCDLASAVVDAQAAHTGRQPRLVPIATADYPTPARRPANSELDTTQLTATFGYEPRPWREGVAEVVAELFRSATRPA